MSITREWLESRFVGLDDARQDTRECMGESYGVCTDGKAVVGVRGVSLASVGKFGGLASITGDAPQGESCSLAALREWCGEDDYIVKNTRGDHVRGAARPGGVIGMAPDMCMNRALLRHVLPNGDDAVLVSVLPSMVRVFGDGWFAVAMGMMELGDGPALDLRNLEARAR